MPAKGRKGSLNTVFCSRRMDFSFDACRKASGSRLNQKQLLMLKMKYKEAHEVHIKALWLYLGQYGQTLGEISQWKLFLFPFFHLDEESGREIPRSFDLFTFWRIACWKISSSGNSGESPKRRK